MKSDDSNPLTQLPRNDKIRVLLVDDHAVVRQGLRMFIKLQDDMEVAGEGKTGGEAVELASMATWSPGSMRAE